MGSGKKILVDSQAPKIAERTLDKSGDQSPVNLEATGVRRGPAADYVTEMRRLSANVHDVYGGLYRHTRGLIQNVAGALEDLLATDQELADDVKKSMAGLDGMAEPEAGAGTGGEAGESKGTTGVWAE